MATVEYSHDLKEKLSFCIGTTILYLPTEVKHQYFELATNFNFETATQKQKNDMVMVSFYMKFIFQFTKELYDEYKSVFSGWNADELKELKNMMTYITSFNEMIPIVDMQNELTAETPMRLEFLKGLSNAKFQIHKNNLLQQLEVIKAGSGE